MIHICDVCEFVVRVSSRNYGQSDCERENCAGIMRPLSELVEVA